MATSGVTSFTMTRDSMIAASLRLLRELGAGAVPSTDDLVNCNQALNMMLKYWQVLGIPLWTYTEVVIPLVAGINKYPIGPTAAYLATAGCTITAGGSGGTPGTYALGIADATGTGAAGTYTITGTAVTAINITAAGSSYSASPTLTFPLGGVIGAAATCTPIGITTGLPLRPVDAFIRTIATSNDQPLTPISRTDFDDRGNKTNQGTTSEYHYDAQLGNAQIYLPTTPSDSTQEIHLVIQRPLQDIVSATDNFDLPAEWFLPVKWGLADELSLEYGASDSVAARLEKKALALRTSCFDFSVEESSVFFSVDLQRR